MPNRSPTLSRRTFIRRSGTAGILAAGVGPYLKFAPAAFANAGPSSPLAAFRHVPFSQPLPLPGRLRDIPVASFGPNAACGPVPGTADALVGSGGVYHGIAPEYFDASLQAYRRNDDASNRDYRIPESGQQEGAPLNEKLHLIDIREFDHEFFAPGAVKTPMCGYNGQFPGKTMRARIGERMVCRVRNNCPDLESSLHLHGGHSPSHADGHPCYYTLPGKARDHFYPHLAPIESGKMDLSHAQSTIWYHDHGNDVTTYNVVHGLAGLGLVTDEIEEGLIKAGVLPDVDLRTCDIRQGGLLCTEEDGRTTLQGKYDIPLALTDQRFNADGSLWWDSFDHDGRLGDVPTVNGKAQPFFNVEPRPYRFRIVCASPARIYTLRLSNGQTMTQIGHDSWLLPRALEVSEITFVPGNRLDVIVDFSRLKAGQEIYLENVMQQSNGRKPDGIDRSSPTRLLKFVVGAGKDPKFGDCTVKAGDVLRPHERLLEKDASVTRFFELNRSNGAWQINHEFYSAYRVDAKVRKGSLEKWVLRNSSGGWWHPFHSHLEGHQILRVNGKEPALESWRYKTDTAQLEENMTIEFLIRFRTFTGPFVFHCHNNNHEDMRMMKQVEVCDVVPGTNVLKPTLLNGQWFSVPKEVSGIPEDYVRAHPGLFS